MPKLDKVKTNIPNWLWRSWSNAYGEKICQKIANASLKDREKLYKESGISFFKKKILEINENNENWFYGDQPEFDSSDLESREYFEGEYDYFYDGV